MVVYDARAEQQLGEPFHPSLEMTFRGHRQSVLAVDLQPSVSSTVSSSYLPRQSATHDEAAEQDGGSYDKEDSNSARHALAGPSLRRGRSAPRGRQAAPHRSSAPPPPRLLTGGADGAVMLWDAKPTVRALRFLGHQGPVLGCAFGPPELAGYGAASLDGLGTHHASLLLASCGHDGYIRLWVPNLRRTSSTYPARGSYQVNGGSRKPGGAGSSFTRSTRRPLAGANVTSDWSAAAPADAESVSAWRAHTGAARAIAFARDGSAYLYSVGDDKSLKCWDLTYASGPAALPPPSSAAAAGAAAAFTTGGLLSSYPYSTASLPACEPTSGYMSGAAGSRSRFVAGYGGASGHTNWVRCLAVQSPYTSSSFFHYIASGGDDGCIRVWDSRTRGAAHVFYEPQASVRGLDFHPDGYCLASGDVRGNVNVFDLRQSSSNGEREGSTKRRKWHGLLQHYGAAHDGAVNAVSFASSGGWLLSGGEDALVKLWDVKEGFLYCTMQAHEAAVKACRFADSGAYFATGGADKVAMLWRSGLPRHSLAHPAVPAMPLTSSSHALGLEERKAEEDEEEKDETAAKAETRARDEQAWYDEVAAEHHTSTSTSASSAKPAQAHRSREGSRAGQAQGMPEPQPVPRRAVSWQDEVGRKPPAQPQAAAAKREKLVRSEERYSELRNSPSQPPPIATEAAPQPRHTSPTPERHDDNGNDEQTVGHSAGQTPEAHAPQRPDEGGAEQHNALVPHSSSNNNIAVATTDSTSELPQRVARLEAAIEQLASMVQGQQAAQESELLALREVNHERQEQHHSEVVELKGMLQSLITQQEHFLRQLAANKQDSTTA